MKAISMSFEEVFAELEASGSEGVRAIYARYGARENQFGVGLGKLRALAKKLKTNHPLAMQLWASGNADAMILATILMDYNQLTAQEIEAMLKPLTYYKLIDELVYNVIVNTHFADEFRLSWLDSAQEMIGRAGWNLQIAVVDQHDGTGIDFDATLNKIEVEMKTAPRRKQESMNQCLVEIGIRFPEFTQRGIKIGEKLGRLDDKPVMKGCVSSYAPEWIAAVLQQKNKAASV